MNACAISEVVLSFEIDGFFSWVVVRRVSEQGLVWTPGLKLAVIFRLSDKVLVFGLSDERVPSCFRSQIKRDTLSYWQWHPRNTKTNQVEKLNCLQHVCGASKAKRSCVGSTPCTPPQDEK